jgi:hypothetical protein
LEHDFVGEEYLGGFIRPIKSRNPNARKWMTKPSEFRRFPEGKAELLERRVFRGSRPTLASGKRTILGDFSVPRFGPG